MSDGQILGGRDLHVVDVVAVPDRLEDAVGEPQHQDVLHGLLAEVMVDAIDLMLGKDLVDPFVEFAALARSVPNGFSITTRLGPRSSPASPATPSWATMGA